MYHIDFLPQDHLPLLETMEQKTYPFPLKGVDSDALYVMEKLRQAGYTAYLVGGSVRDLILQKTPKDYDISTSAKPEEIKQLFRNCILIGRRFRLAHIRFGKKILEVSTFRTGDMETDALIVRDNEWGNPEQDVLRRDFTINGLFYDPSTETIIDYVEGYPDLQKKYLRTIGQPYMRFKQDPVRMLRLLKFQARFGFEIDKDAHISLLECRHEILKSSPSRVFEELLRMLESGSGKAFFKLLAEHGMLQMLLPALAQFLETPDGKEIYDYLEEVDTTFHAPGEPLLERPVLLSCLVFPFLQKRLAALNHTPHLGEIQQIAYQLIDEIFQPFFPVPRMLKMMVVSVLTAQYRITPLEKRKQQRIRIPHDPDFALALKFLDVRACLEPALQTTWEDWDYAYGNVEQEDLPVRRKRRSRPRKRGPRKES